MRKTKNLTIELFNYLSKIKSKTPKNIYERNIDIKLWKEYKEVKLNFLNYLFKLSKLFSTKYSKDEVDEKIQEIGNKLMRHLDELVDKNLRKKIEDIKPDFEKNFEEFEFSITSNFDLGYALLPRNKRRKYAILLYITPHIKIKSDSCNILIVYRMKDYGLYFIDDEKSHRSQNEKIEDKSYLTFKTELILTNVYDYFSHNLEELVKLRKKSIDGIKKIKEEEEKIKLIKKLEDEIIYYPLLKTIEEFWKSSKKQIMKMILEQ